MVVIEWMVINLFLVSGLFLVWNLGEDKGVLEQSR
jgi:hypothetical protein